MYKDNITPLKVGSALDNVRKALNVWRSFKKTQGEKIPQDLWEQIIPLLNKYTEKEIRSVLYLTPTQLERGKQLTQSQNVLEELSISPCEESIDFCEAQEKPTYPLAYKPAEAFATNTSIVELRRPDGMLMKIHICTDRFDELLSAFLKG